MKIPDPFCWLKKHAREIVLGLLLLVSCMGFSAWIWLHPYYVRAQHYDLSNIEELPVTTLIYDRQGNIVGKVFEENRLILSKGKVPELALKSIVAAEDRRFYKHHGIDWRGIARALWINTKSMGIEQGASTITQQLAKHIIGDFRRTLDRKLLEAFLARRLEAIYSKDEILRLYLNRIYYGSGYFGLETAARGYFGKSSSELNLSECAMVMSVVRAPTSSSPRGNYQQAEQRMKRTLKVMLSENLISAVQYQDAMNLPVHVVERESSGLKSYFMAAVLGQVEQILELQHREQVPQGLRIYTSLDLALQKTAELEVETSLSELEKTHPSSGFSRDMDTAYMAMDADNGEVLVYVGGRNFNNNQFDHLRLMKRDSSGLLNPFVHAVALDSWGLNPATLLDASYLSDDPAEPNSSALKEAADRNSLMWHDSMVFNSPFSERRLFLNLGRSKMEDWLRSIEWSHHPGGFPEDIRTLNPLQWATLYRSLSREGKAIIPSFIRRVETVQGQILFERGSTPPETQLLPPTVASQVLYALQKRSNEGSSRLINQYLKSPIDIAVTDASSKGNLDAWSAGLSPHFVSLAWMGWDSNRSFPSRRAALDATLPLLGRMEDHLEAQGTPSGLFIKNQSLTKVEIERQTGRIQGFAYLQPKAGNTLLYLTDDQLDKIKTDVADSTRPTQRPENWSAWFSTLLTSEGEGSSQPLQDPDFLNVEAIPEKTEFIVPGQRGDILSRDGKILATNRKAQQLVCRWPPLQKAGTEDAVVAWVEERMKSAGELLGESPPPLNRLEIIEAYRYRRFLPLTLKSDLSRDQIRKFGESSLEREGLALQGIPYRYYPQGNLMAHTLGYLSLKQAPGRGQYQAMEVIHETHRGESGLEAALEEFLTGLPGTLNIATDRDGFLMNTTMGHPSSKGANAYLSIDCRWQEAAEKALAAQSLPGAAVIMDIKNGDILAMASFPTFDPNRFVPRLTAADWKKLMEDGQKPMLHRAFRQHYPPGSVFKVVTTLASMQAGTFDATRRITCPGYYDIGNVHYSLPREKGVVSFREALALSFNTYFFDLSLRTGRDQMIQMAKNLGFGRPTGLILPSEEAGLIPDPKFVLQQHQRWMGPGDVTNMAIGQGDVLTTPLQMAVFMSTVANRGHMFQPRLVQRLVSPEGAILKSFPVQETGSITLSQDQWQILHDGMRGVVTDGTARKFLDVPLTIAAKTGTAQAGGGKKAQIAWAAGFFPFEKPEIAFVFMLEGHEGLDISSSSNAVPLAAEALNLGLKANVSLERPLTAQLPDYSR